MGERNGMQTLCRALSGIPELKELYSRMAAGGGPAAVGGLSPVHKAHLAAALRQETGRPVFFLTADEQASRRYGEDLTSLTGERALILAPRELNFYNVESASRRWEHQRMQVLYRMQRGEVPVVLCDLEAALLRTLPPALLQDLAMELTVGMELPIEVLMEQLVICGYKRCLTVEGPGQFAVRGGIVDFFSPAEPQAVRLEFFGDEIDTMSYMDTDSQRRTEALEKTVLLPSTEALPAAAPGGQQGLVRALEKVRAGAAKKKNTPPALLETLDQDLERLREERMFPAVDRYLELIYPHFATALDYLPENALVLVDEHLRLSEKCKNLLWQHGQDVEVMLQSGALAPGLARFYLEEEEFYGRLPMGRTAFLDNFLGARYPSPPQTSAHRHS